jgi:hypothetical protein
MARATTTNTRKRLLLDHIDARILDIALRKSIGRDVSQDDETFLAKHLGSVSMLWSKANAFRNYHQEMGDYR